MNLQSQPINDEWPKLKNGFSKQQTNNNIDPQNIEIRFNSLLHRIKPKKGKKKKQILHHKCTKCWNLRDF